MSQGPAGRGLRQRVRRLAVQGAVRWLRWRARLPTASGPGEGLAVIGFLGTASGLGAAARGLLEALAPLGPVAIPLDDLAPTPALPGGWSGPGAATRSEVGVHLYNPDIFLALVRRHGGRLFRRQRINLAIVNWETEQLPPLWREVLSLYDRLAAPSSFTAAAVARATGRPVAVVPNCVPLRPPRVRARADRQFEFLTLFDHHSDLDRKNPLAAIRAFRLAGERLPPGASARLRVKCHATTPADLVARLRGEAAGAAVEILPATLSAEGMQALWQECDCLLSLHRSEGFGLPVAEALARGIPAIATRQGGVLDFLDDRGGWLIDGPPAGPAVAGGGYPEWSGWIEPDIAAAAAAIRATLADYPAEVARAAAGRDRLGTQTSPDAVRRALLAALAESAAIRDRPAAQEQVPSGERPTG